MKFYQILFIFSFILVGCNNNIKFENDLTRENIKGEVKLIKEYTYKIFLKTKSQTSSHLDVKEILESETIRNYDTNGNIKKEVFYNKEHLPASTSVYKYNNNNELTKKIFLYHKDTVLTINYKYDKKGNVILIEWHEGTHISKSYFNYDKKGNLKQETSFNQSGGLDYDLHIKYDNKGYLKEKIWLNENGEQDLKWTFINNHRGKPIEQKVFDSENNMTVIANFKYNNMGYLIEEMRSMKNLDPYIMEYKYIFDNKNNWIEKHTIRNGITIFKFKREIIYY